MAIVPKVGIDKIPTEFVSDNSSFLEDVASQEIITPESQNVEGGIFRTLQERLSSVFINVREHGAIGDGAADDTAALTMAFASGLNIYYLPPGTYNLTEDIPVTDGSMVFAAGVTLSGGTLLTPGLFTSIGFPSDLITTQANLHVYNGDSNDDGNIRVGGLDTAIGLNINFENVGSGAVAFSGRNDAGGVANTIKFGFGAIAAGAPATTVLELNQAEEVAVKGDLFVHNGPTDDDGNIRIGGLTSGLGADLNFASVASGAISLSSRNDNGGANNTIKFGFGAVSGGSPANTALTIDQTGKISGSEFVLDVIRMNSGPNILTGTGSPEGSVASPVGSLFLRTDGGASTTLYVKESGTGTTGWVAK